MVVVIGAHAFPYLCPATEHLLSMSRLKPYSITEFLLKKIGALVRPPIGYSTVLKMQKNFQNFGMTKTPHLLTIGRPAKITPEMGQVVVHHILY